MKEIQETEYECPKCGALNTAQEDGEYELLECWQCGHEYEVDGHGAILPTLEF